LAERIIEPPPKMKKEWPTTVRMRLSRDGRFVIISISLIAFADDIRQLLEGKRKTVKFRLLPPKQRNR